MEGGAETPVLDHHQAGLWRSWAVVEQGIYFVTAETPDRPLIEFFSFATGQVTQVAAPEKPIIQDILGAGGFARWTMAALHADGSAEQRYYAHGKLPLSTYQKGRLSDSIFHLIITFETRPRLIMTISLLLKSDR